jgi:hypothetical protein
MKIISHRGNLIGRISEKENHPNYINAAISSGYEVEIDLWFQDDKFFLGHDNPQYEIEINWIHDRKNKLWVHAKNLEVIPHLYNTDINWFWHDTDKLTITSKGFIWCYPNVFIENGITVALEHQEVPNNIFAVCTDEPIKFIK